MPEFGINFKKVRESKGRTLDQIAAETRVNARFLKAIEDEEFEVLPGGIVGRGFIRAYASSLGINGESAVAEFERRSHYREPPLAERFRTSSTSSKTPRNFYPIAAGILVLLIVVFYVVTRETAPSVAIASRPPVVTTPAPPPPPPPAPPAATVTGEAAPQEDATVPPPSAKPPAATVPPAVVPAASGKLVLEIEAHENTWIKVTSDGSVVVAGEIIHPGATRRFAADNAITLVAGNAGGIHIKINGHDQPAMGQSGQVHSLTITPETLKTLVP